MAVALTWTASAGAESYSVTKLDPTTGLFAPLASGLTQTAYTDSGLQPSTSCTYRVTAVNSAGVSAPAEVTTVTTALNPPTAPNSLTVGAVSATSIGLSWVDTASNEQGFQLERSLDGTAFTTLVVLAANTTNYTDATVAAGTTYWYRVLAFNPDGSSAYSNSVSTTTTNIPAAPRSLTASSTSKSVIALAWIDASADETGFTVEHSLDSATFTVLATLPPNATNYQHTGLTPNKMHYYRVRAFNSAGSSAHSNVASAKTSPK
jgi:titin